MPADAVLWDIGADIGSYALYAAKRGVRVLAFEPSAATLYALTRNIAGEQETLNRIKTSRLSRAAAYW